MHKIMMARRGEWQGHYILDDNEVCVAKTCSKCKKELPRGRFSPSKSDRMGLKSCCKSCHSRTETDRLKVIRALNPKRVPVDWNYRLNRTQEQLKSDQIELHPTGQKECANCNEVLPLSSFGRVLKYRDGLEFSCKRCRQIKGKKADPDLNNKRTKKYQDKNRRRTRKQVLEDRSHLHPDDTKKCRKCKLVKSVIDYYDKSYTKSGLSYECKMCHNEDVIRRKTERDKRYWASRGIPLECYVCLESWIDGHHSDHVIPKRLEGSDGYRNRLPLCSSHNKSKWMTPLEIWLRETMPEKMDEVLARVAGYGVDYRVPDGVYEDVRVFTDRGGQIQWEMIKL